MAYRIHFLENGTVEYADIGYTQYKQYQIDLGEYYLRTFFDMQDGCTIHGIIYRLDDDSFVELDEYIPTINVKR